MKYKSSILHLSKKCVERIFIKFPMHSRAVGLSTVISDGIVFLRNLQRYNIISRYIRSRS